LLFPFGAPSDAPPCVRQRPFGIAGDRHGLPRKALSRPGESDPIRTVQGTGYAFDETFGTSA